MTKRLPQLISWIVLVLSIGTIAHILWHNRESFALLGDVDAWVLLGILALKCAYYVVHGFRYQIVLEASSGRPVAFIPWFRTYMLGNFLNAIVPQLGNVYRGIQLKQTFGIAYTHFISTLLSVAWMGNLFNLAAVAAILAAFRADLALVGIRAWPIVLALALAIALAPIVMDRLVGATRFKRRSLAWVHEKLSELLRVSLALVRDRVFMAKLMALIVVLFAMVCGLFMLCFLALGIRVGFVEITLFFAILQLATYVQLTPGNIGVTELAYGLLSDQLGFGMAEGILAGTILRAAGYANILALAIPMGGIGLLRQSMRLQSTRSA